MDEIKRGEQMKKRKIRLHWTCSDYCHHEHRWMITAYLCGRCQYFLRVFLLE